MLVPRRLESSNHSQLIHTVYYCIYSLQRKERERMEATAAAAISEPKTAHQFCVLTPKIGFSSPPAVSLAVQRNLKKGVILRCGQVSRLKCAKEADKILIEKELNMEEELIGMKKLNEKCKEINGGIVELMECLEREAIMGEDEGKEPNDYNRRAKIFDKSSRVFQALKQQSPSPSASNV